MINVKTDVYAKLVQHCIGADVSDEYPKSWKTMPKVTFTEEDNSVAIWADNAEDTARIVIRIDCWASGSTSQLVAQVDAAMSALGFIRTQCRDVPITEMFKHKQMRYECLVDVDGNVFHDNNY